MPSLIKRSCGDAEVQSVPGIVAEGENHPGTTIRRPGDPVHLLRRRRGEDVAEHRTIREPGPHHTVIGREVAGASTDHEADLALQRSTGTDETRGTFDTLHVLRIRRGEALDHVVLELGRVVVDVGHGTSKVGRPVPASSRTEQSLSMLMKLDASQAARPMNKP